MDSLYFPTLLFIHRSHESTTNSKSTDCQYSMLCQNEKHKNSMNMYKQLTGAGHRHTRRHSFTVLNISKLKN